MKTKYLEEVKSQQISFPILKFHQVLICINLTGFNESLYALQRLVVFFFKLIVFVKYY